MTETISVNSVVMSEKVDWWTLLRRVLMLLWDKWQTAQRKKSHLPIATSLCTLLRRRAWIFSDSHDRPEAGSTSRWTHVRPPVVGPRRWSRLFRILRLEQWMPHSGYFIFKGGIEEDWQSLDFKFSNAIFAAFFFFIDAKCLREPVSTKLLTF